MSFDYQRYEPYSDWKDDVTYDAKVIAALMGWRIDEVYFRGFSSQGDGACFEGYLGYAKGCAEAVKRYAPNETALHNIAERWQALQARCFYSLEGNVSHRGHYYHEYSTSFNWDDARGRYRALPDSAEADASDIARDYMRWLYRALEREYDYQHAWALAAAWQALGDDMRETKVDARQLVRDMRQAIKSGITAAPSICTAIRATLRRLLEQGAEASAERAAIADNFHYYPRGGDSLNVAEFAAEFC